ncbi:BRIX1 [Symbiodinium sp. KB8]|nr:BRIX1 [Symbiodinium sp. KB8]
MEEKEEETKDITPFGLAAKKVAYINKQRVLVFASRGITARYRHLLEDIRAMLPHHKRDAKLDAKDNLRTINEIAEMKSCNTCLFFEVRKRRDLYLWISKTPNGPSAKFHVVNVHTMDELRLTGNSLKGSRPFLSFDKAFDELPHLQLLKEMFTQVFNTPRGHPKSQPFYDHIISMYYLAKDAKGIKKILAAGREPTTLVEIGPRFVLNPIRIFKNSFGGPTLYQNPFYQSPNEVCCVSHVFKSVSLNFNSLCSSEGK